MAAGGDRISAGNGAGGRELYDDLGGESGVATIVDQFLWLLADDRRINHYFAETNLVRLRTKLIRITRLCTERARIGPCSPCNDSPSPTSAWESLCADLLDRNDPPTVNAALDPHCAWSRRVRFV